MLLDAEGIVYIRRASRNIKEAAHKGIQRVDSMFECSRMGRAHAPSLCARQDACTALLAALDLGMPNANHGPDSLLWVLLNDLLYDENQQAADGSIVVPESGRQLREDSQPLHSDDVSVR